jgi:hypothetical protein
MAPKCRAKHKEKVANAPASLYERFMDDASEEMVKPKMGARTPLLSPPLLSSPLPSSPLTSSHASEEYGQGADAIKQSD